MNTYKGGVPPPPTELCNDVTIKAYTVETHEQHVIDIDMAIGTSPIATEKTHAAMHRTHTHHIPTLVTCSVIGTRDRFLISLLVLIILLHTVGYFLNIS